VDDGVIEEKISMKYGDLHDVLYNLTFFIKIKASLKHTGCPYADST
jgi:hypothetical protein